MANAAVEVQLTAAIGEFQKQMAGAAAALRDASRQMGADLRSVPPAANEASEGVSRFTDMLKEHRREVRAEAGLTKVLARDLSALGIEASGAGGAIAHLVASFAIGGGIGLALGAVKVIAEQFKKLREEEEKAGESLKKWHEEMDKAHEKAVADIQDLRDKLAGLRPIQILAREQAGVVAEIERLEGQLDKLRGRIGALNDQGQVDILAKRTIDKTKKEIEEVESQLEALKRRRDDLSEKGSLVVESEDRSYDDKQAEARRKAREKELEEARRAKEQEIAEREKLEEQFRQKDIAADAWWEKEKEKGLQDAAKRAEQILKQQAAEEEAARQEKQRQMEQDQIAQAQAFAQMERSVEHYLSPLRHSINQMFTGLLDGTMDLAQAWNALWKGMLSTVVDTLVEMATKFVATKIAEMIIGKTAAISETQGNIAVAVSGAAASQAAIPFVGPALATAAAGEMLGFLEGLTAPLLASASGGYDIPSRVNPLTQLHAEEMVLPAAIANPLRAAIEGGTFGGGASNTFTIYAFDGPDVERSLLKIKNRLERNGRW